MRHGNAACAFKTALLMLACVIIQAGERLSPYVRHHERLDYGRAAVEARHQRVRRATNAAAAPPLTLEFEALQRPFRLRLRREARVFSADAVLVGPSGRYEPLQTDHIYEGHLEGVPNSFVHGSVHDGVFQGKIETPDGNYYVEKAHHYYPHNHSSSFHSVIYSEEHIEDPFQHLERGRGPFGGCGVDGDVSEWMHKVQNSAIDDDETEFRAAAEEREHRRRERERPSAARRVAHDARHYKYTEEAQRHLDAGRSRSRRAPRQGGATSHLPDSRGTCSLSVETDPMLWRHVFEKEGGDDRRTREELTSMVASHVKAVNRVYDKEQFDGSYAHRGIQFEVQRLKIDDDSTCRPSYRGRDRNKFCVPNVDVSNFLNLHSEDDHDAFCLSYVFTYRDFNKGTLGLAWVASPAGASGGICERYKPFADNIGGSQRTNKRSLNTGIITFVNYHSRVPPRVSQLTLAHEIGHNMGSPHDWPSDCTPGGPNGNYIMFASATSGDLPNNSKFSECSRRNISSVLDAISSGKKRDCFTKSDGAFCGNKIVEDGEECDCGFDDAECTESCCYPNQVSESDRRSNASAEGCRRRQHTQCSPSEGPCCDRRCSFVATFERLRCRSEDNCTYDSYCDGYRASCPAPPPRPDMTECNSGTKVCLSGECTGSICLKHGLKECFLTSDVIEDRGKLCEVACQRGDNTSTCRSSSELGLGGGQGIYMTAGAACDNFQGYCDVFLKCRRVDAEGPLVQLKNLLFSEQTLMTIVEWVTHYWWAVLLMAVAFVVVMALFIRCCAVHTPSSNPKRAPARKFTDTLKHPMDTLKRQHRHPRRGGGGGGARSVPVREEAELVVQSSNSGGSSSGGGGGRPGRATGPPPAYQPQAGPVRHGFGAGRGHYSRQGARDDVESGGASGGRAAERQRQQKQQKQQKRRSQGTPATRHV
ncbi:disintegrin and metalloproteinase domain-containing protein 10-like [Amphibalanus amphitrite]|uniref:disintegrin and metalloproteinase domain-containing protein 10-like n=1 Tax=Amphibalanus amphitrite TaxID=1232801 RepID=UPI001C91A2F1|nr:disintegrin and metalloproteinase domain-containing protein 10-like [Amphibalanus amphitrite]XP_043222629.1 disintegrin and metalloproteinase domain-containing protein 10-like [Amphibalanus amphitrite]